MHNDDHKLSLFETKPLDAAQENDPLKTIIERVKKRRNDDYRTDPEFRESWDHYSELQKEKELATRKRGVYDPDAFRVLAADCLLPLAERIGMNTAMDMINMLRDENLLVGMLDALSTSYAVLASNDNDEILRRKAFKEVNTIMMKFSRVGVEDLVQLSPEQMEARNQKAGDI